MGLNLRQTLTAGALAVVAGIALCNKEEPTAPVKDVTTQNSKKVRQVSSIGGQEINPHQDPTLEEDLPAECARPDGNPYMEQDDPRYLSQWNDPRNFSVQTWEGINCTAAEIANRETEATVDWIYATLVEAGLDVQMTENLDGVVFNDGVNRSFVNVEEADCDPQDGCSYAAELETYATEDINTSLNTAADCILNPQECDPEAADKIYIEPESSAYTADSPEALAEQLRAALKANSEDTAQ